jgi:hypothetical protein
MPYGALTVAIGRNSLETPGKTRPSTGAAAAPGCRYGAHSKPVRWSQKVTRTSNALDLDSGVFRMRSPRARSRGRWRARPSEQAPEVGAVSLGDVDADLLRQPRRQEAARRAIRRTLMRAKQELRKLYGRA